MDLYPLQPLTIVLFYLPLLIPKYHCLFLLAKDSPSSNLLLISLKSLVWTLLRFLPPSSLPRQFTRSYAPSIWITSNFPLLRRTLRKLSNICFFRLQLQLSRTSSNCRGLSTEIVLLQPYRGGHPGRLVSFLQQLKSASCSLRAQICYRGMLCRLNFEIISRIKPVYQLQFALQTSFC